MPYSVGNPESPPRGREGGGGIDVWQPTSSNGMLERFVLYLAKCRGGGAALATGSPLRSVTRT